MPLFLLLALGCNNSGTIELEGDDDTGSADGADTGENDESGQDTGEETGEDTEDTEDTEEVPPEEAVTYAGALELVITYRGDNYDYAVECLGDFEVTVEVDGSVGGDAECEVDGYGGYGVSGPVRGEVVNGEFVGIWAYSYGEYELEADLEGEVGERFVSDVRDEVERYFEADGTMVGDPR